jgi:hypothetical protein
MRKSSLTSVGLQSDSNSLLTNITEALSEEAFTDRDDNCYDVPNHGRFCSMPDFININLPDQNGDTHRNYMWVKLFGDKAVDQFKCCPNRFVIDGVLDDMQGQFTRVYKGKHQ